MILWNVAVYAGLAAVGGPVLFLRSFRDMRVRRLLQNTPTTHVHSMPMGLVEVQGQVEPRSVLTAPFSGRPCAYWQVDIATRSRRDAWSIVHRNASGNPFFLKDESGTAMVYPSGADCRINFGVEEQTNGFGVPDCYMDYMKSQNLHMAKLWSVGAMRFRERTLEERQPVFVLGTACPRSRAVSISDDDMLAATGTDDAQASRVRTLDSGVDAVIRRGESETTFLISQQSEKYLAAQLGVRVWAELIGGPALTLLGLSYWLSVFMGSHGR
jgi:hypothetical protein